MNLGKPRLSYVCNVRFTGKDSRCIASESSSVTADSDHTLMEQPFKH